MRIDIKEASVKTATVEIKSLIVSDKQVTLSVFRQIQESDVIDWGILTLRGLLWGRVNYHPDNCAKERPHVHLVWQEGDELRRSRLERDRPYRGHGAWGELISNLVDHTKEVIRWQILAGDKERIPHYRDEVRIDLFVNKRKVEVSFYRDELEPLRALESEDSEWGKRSNEEILKKREKAKAQMPSFEKLRQAALSAEDEVTAYEAKWATLWQTIEALPQLFIAI